VVIAGQGGGGGRDCGTRAFCFLTILPAGPSALAEGRALDLAGRWDGPHPAAGQGALPSRKKTHKALALAVVRTTTFGHGRRAKKPPALGRGPELSCWANRHNKLGEPSEHGPGEKTRPILWIPTAGRARAGGPCIPDSRYCLSNRAIFGVHGDKIFPRGTSTVAAGRLLLGARLMRQLPRTQRRVAHRIATAGRAAANSGGKPRCRGKKWAAGKKKAISDIAGLFSPTAIGRRFRATQAFGRSAKRGRRGLIGAPKNFCPTIAIFRPPTLRGGNTPADGTGSQNLDLTPPTFLPEPKTGAARGFLARGGGSFSPGRTRDLPIPGRRVWQRESWCIPGPALSWPGLRRWRLFRTDDLKIGKRDLIEKKPRHPSKTGGGGTFPNIPTVVFKQQRRGFGFCFVSPAGGGNPFRGRSFRRLRGDHCGDFPPPRAMGGCQNGVRVPHRTRHRTLGTTQVAARKG